MPNKIIFLDVDGVLNNYNMIKDGRYTLDQTHDWKNCGWIDDLCVARLKFLVDLTGADVVLSSTWRLNMEHDHTKRLLEVFKENGINCIGRTPSFLDRTRGREIMDYVKKKMKKGTTFVIIDDEVPDIAPWFSDSCVVYVKNGLFSGGLQIEHVERAFKILNREWK